MLYPLPQRSFSGKMPSKPRNEEVRTFEVGSQLGHLAAALGVPTISIYGATDAQLTGAIGERQIHLQTQFPCSPCLLKDCNKLSGNSIDPPCYLSESADSIWLKLNQQII